MAFRRRNIIKQRNIPLRVVKRSAKRLKVQHVEGIIRDEGVQSKEDIDVQEDVNNSNNECFDEDLLDQEDSMEQPSSSLYMKRKIKAAERWESIRNLALHTIICSMSKAQQYCCICKSVSGIVKCYNCGPATYYCKSCAIKIHQHSLFHHFMEIWQVVVINVNLKQ